MLYAALYAGFGAASPFLPAFLETRGLTADQIGFVLAAGTTARLIAGPLAGRWADRTHALRGIFAAATTCAALFGLASLAAHSFAPLLIAVLLLSAALAPAAQLADALTLAAAEPRQHKRRFEYGWVRGAGSAAFIVGLIGSGQATQAVGPHAALVLQSMLLILAALWIAAVPNDLMMRQTRQASCTNEDRDSFWTLLRIPLFRRIIFIAALVLGSHALHDGFAVIRWTAAGMSAVTASLLWSEQVVAEVAVFLIIGPALLGWLGPGRALALSAGAGALRWSVMALSTDAYILAAVEPLHGLSFALLHLAAMRVIATVIPARAAATAQALYGTVGIGAALALMTLASGLLYQAIGGGAFWVMAALSLTALPIALTMRDP